MSSPSLSTSPAQGETTKKIRKKSLSLPKKSKKWHINAMGEVIYKDHSSFGIMKQIQMGIRTSISNMDQILQVKDPPTLTLKDFKQIDKLSFPREGSTKTPPHNYEPFKFYTYCAKPFRDLRVRFGISIQNYLVSLCHDKSLAIIRTPGKSDSLFFFSQDMKYILKTVTKKESKYLRKILPHYYNHVMQNPSTLITRFYGLYAIKPRKVGHNVRFIVMNNVFDTQLPIHIRYDLKGSTVGRKCSEKELKRETPVFKDLDIMEQKQKLHVKKEMQLLLLEQLSIDCAWLESMKIMDYSLLLGIVRLGEKKNQSKTLEVNDRLKSIRDMLMKSSNNQENTNLQENVSTDSQKNKHEKESVDNIKKSDVKIEKDTLKVKETDLTIEKESTISDTKHEEEKNKPDNETSSKESLSEPSSVQTESSLNEKPTVPKIKIEEVQNSKGQHVKQPSRIGLISPRSLFKRYSKEYTIPLAKALPNKISEFKKFEGGILSNQLKDGSYEIYYLGIIDLLQEWDNKKRVENFFKSFRYNSTKISSVAPKLYSSRFQEFVKSLLTE